jgi:hypothetical protein
VNTNKLFQAGDVIEIGQAICNWGITPYSEKRDVKSEHGQAQVQKKSGLMITDGIPAPLKKADK